MNNKIRVTFKSPDAMDETRNDYYAKYCITNNLSILDRDARMDIDDMISSVTDKFIKYNEYITVEFDLDTGTAKVIPVSV